MWCFLRERFVAVGILSIAIALAVKPQDAGLVWLYFALAGGVYRKRALQSLVVALAVSLPCLLWVWQVAPHWIQEWHSNVLAFSVHGGASDPALASKSQYALDMLINLQTVMSAIRDDPRIYNPATYLICGPLLMVWAWATLRYRSSQKRALLAVAAIAALSLLPTAHRGHDAKLLLLMVPACAMLWEMRDLTGRLAFWITAAALIVTGDLPWIILQAIFVKMHSSATPTVERVLTAIWVVPIPLILAISGAFYLVAYLRYKQEKSGRATRNAAHWLATVNLRT